MVFHGGPGSPGLLSGGHRVHTRHSEYVDWGIPQFSGNSPNWQSGKQTSTSSDSDSSLVAMPETVAESAVFCGVSLLA